MVELYQVLYIAGIIILLYGTSGVRVRNRAPSVADSFSVIEMAEQCPLCPRVCVSYRKLSYHLDKEHAGDNMGVAVAVLQHARQQAEQRAAARPRLEEARRAIRRGAGEPRAPARPALPLPYMDDINVETAFGNRRTFRWYARHELNGVSDANQPATIAEEKVEGSGASLLMDARRGFAPARKTLAGIVEKLGLSFHERELNVPLPGGETVTVTLHYRKLSDVVSFFFRFLTPEHCRPRKLYTADGDRVYSDPYTAEEIHRQCEELRRRDPTAVLVALKLYWDETNLTKNGERTACPVTVSCLAFPIEEIRKRTAGVASLLLAYLTKVPERILANKSRDQKSTIRKALHRAQIRAMCNGVTDDSMVALVGRRMMGAHRRYENVYISVLSLSLDYPKIAEATQTRQNEGCWMCYARKGNGFWRDGPYDTRTVASQRRLIGMAWAQNPSSATARYRALTPYSLHPAANPCFNVVGLDVFQGTAPPLMHMVWHGLWPKLVEVTFGVIQVQVAPQAFKQLGARIDAWITAKVAPGGWLKTSFRRGFSHFLYGAYTNPRDPWAATVKFGQIAGKDVMRDIARFWRLMLVDLFPQYTRMLDLFTDFLEWVEMVYWLVQSEHSLAVLSSLKEAWRDQATSIFGSREFELMIKFHMPDHVGGWTRSRGTLLYDNDEEGEALHPRHAKDLWRRTNFHDGCEATMAIMAERRDALELLLNLHNQGLVRGQAGRPVAAGRGGGGGAANAGNAPRAVLMGVTQRVCRLTLVQAQAAYPELQQLRWATAVFLQTATGGDPEVPYPAGMPTLTSDVIEVRKGVHVVRWPRRFPAAQKGGAFLHAAFAGCSGELCPTDARMSPVFVAIPGAGGVLYYGQLVLCFNAQWLSQEALCYVRWLDTADMVAQRALRPVTHAETAGPFDAYRWSTFPGSNEVGHPAGGGVHYGVVRCSQVLYRAPLIPSLADALDALDPLFRLNTDMWR